MEVAAGRRRVNEAIISLTRFATSRTLDSMHAARSGVPLGFAAIGVLGHVVRHGPVRLSDLGRVSHMQPAALSRQVRLLEANGYLARAGDADDGRVWVVRATPAGRAAYKRIRTVNDRLLAAQLSEWTADELELAAELLERLDRDLRAVREGSRQCVPRAPRTAGGRDA